MQKIYRNWGFYRNILVLPFLKIKYLNFEGELSFQKHRLRKEFWVKLSGNGFFYLNHKKTKNNIFFYIPKKAIHSFKGKAKFIEFQIGINKESDIRRFDNIKW